VHLRLVGAIGFSEVLEVAARVSGTNVVPLSPDRFGEGATLTSLPSDAVDAGEETAYALAARNSGDGVAKRLSLQLDPPSNAVYAPSSTTVNDVPLLDFARTSPLLAMSGSSRSPASSMEALAGSSTISRWSGRRGAS